MTAETLVWLFIGVSIVGGLVLLVVMINLSKIMATKREVKDMEIRVENKLEADRMEARSSLVVVHGRIDKQSEKIGQLIGTTEQVNENVKLLLNRATQ